MIQSGLSRPWSGLVLELVGGKGNLMSYAIFFAVISGFSFLIWFPIGRAFPRPGVSSQSMRRSILELCLAIALLIGFLLYVAAVGSLAQNFWTGKAVGWLAVAASGGAGAGVIIGAVRKPQ